MPQIEQNPLKGMRRVPLFSEPPPPHVTCPTPSKAEFMVLLRKEGPLRNPTHEQLYLCEAADSSPKVGYRLPHPKSS